MRAPDLLEDACPSTCARLLGQGFSYTLGSFVGPCPPGYLPITVETQPNSAGPFTARARWNGIQFSNPVTEVWCIFSNFVDGCGFASVLQLEWQWTQLPSEPSSATPAKRDMSALLQLQEGQLLLFGGRSEQGKALQDTWLYEFER